MNDEQAQRIIKAIVEEHAGSISVEPRYTMEGGSGVTTGFVIARIDLKGVGIYADGEGIAGALAAAEAQLRAVLDIIGYARIPQ
jgi:hypothetical protein